MDSLDLENSKDMIGECKKDEKKRGRKSKKQNEKELINEWKLFQKSFIAENFSKKSSTWEFFPTTSQFFNPAV